MSTVPLPETDSSTANPKTDLWVFGYGSLMWRPGFEFVEQVPARLIGEHRALCVYSFDHRGTPEKPGLVLGLDRGGACRGIAFRVEARLRSRTIEYLRGREQTTHVYREVMRSVWLENEARERGCRSPSSFASSSRDMVAPATIATMCWQPCARSRPRAFAIRNCTSFR